MKTTEMKGRSISFEAVMNKLKNLLTVHFFTYKLLSGYFSECFSNYKKKIEMRKNEKDHPKK